MSSIVDIQSPMQVDFSNEIPNDFNDQYWRMNKINNAFSNLVEDLIQRQVEW